MPPPARITRAPHPQRHVLQARAPPQSAKQKQIILLRKIRQLIERNVLKLARRIPKLVQRPAQITKRNARRRQTENAVIDRKNPSPPTRIPPRRRIPE